MIISHKLKIIFIHVQRTGGTTISNILRENSVASFDNHSQHSNTRTFDPAFLEKYKDYYTFGFTRNPWTRMLSWYSLVYFNDQKSLPEERKRFEKFLELDSAADFTKQFFHYNALDYFSTEKSELIADEIFHYENIESEIGVLLNQFNLTIKEIPVTNETSKKNYKEFYTDKSRSLIAEKCKKDIAYFNYVF
ncbi:MAG: hypothetical protein GQ574_13375 [Crocinitomix sp.]|nr:hypothetical protein [Crocinitomix sp.]